jgi:hypothetical protein
MSTQSPESVRLRNRLGFIDSENPLSVRTLNTLVVDNYDYIGVTYPTTTSEVYTYKTGGAGGTTIAIVTVVYTDECKDELTSVTKS